MFPQKTEASAGTAHFFFASGGDKQFQKTRRKEHYSVSSSSTWRKASSDTPFKYSHFQMIFYVFIAEVASVLFCHFCMYQVLFQFVGITYKLIRTPLSHSALYQLSFLSRLHF